MLKIGAKYTIIQIGFIAQTSKSEVQITRLLEDGRWVYKHRGKRKEFGLKIDSGTLVFDGWDIPVKVDGDIKITRPGGVVSRSFSGNACFNLVGDPVMLRDWIDNKNINPSFNQHDHVLYGVTEPGENLLYPEKYNGGHAVIDSILDKQVEDVGRKHRGEEGESGAPVELPPKPPTPEPTEAELDAEIAKLKAELEKCERPGDVNKDVAVISHNVEKNGIEITFPGPIKSGLVSRMRSAQFRYHGMKKLWYARKNASTEAFAAVIVLEVNSNPGNYLIKRDENGRPIAETAADLVNETCGRSAVFPPQLQNVMPVRFSQPDTSAISFI